MSRTTRANIVFSLVLVMAVWSVPTRAADPEPVDLVVYGGTSAGIAAAVQAHRMGKTVIVIEPSQRVGGLTTGGLGQTDIGNKAAIGGIAREFYEDVAEYYQDPAAWKFQRSDEYRGGGQSKTAAGEAAMWTFEPSAALSIYEDWIERDGIRVDYGKRLDRSAVTMTRSLPARIIAIRMESGETYRARMFIDATYEGDLMAAAGVSYTVGREANSQYGETLNGVQTKMAIHHQLRKGIDPYVVPGDASSGLLPHIDPEGPGEEGGADHRVQAYCFRMCLTDHPQNRIPFEKPDGYQPLWYELMLRNYEAGEDAAPWINSSMPNRKTDTNNRLGFSTDFIGQNYDYPEASYEEREKIVAEHLLYQQGLMWTLANHPRVPENVRKQVSRWGMCKDEFVEGNGWQDQLYIREARRMVGEYVMTQKNCQGLPVEDPIGLAAYTMDSHNQQRYVDENGHVRNEGDVQVGGFPPYGISYRSLVPKRREVSNLLVPVCLSATHIAFGSIRMEPVFMVLGQTTATAAAIAIDDQVAVQNVDYERLANRLLEDKQVLAYTGPEAKPGIDPKTLDGIVVDNSQAKTEGAWMVSNSSGQRVGMNYLHDSDASKGECVVVYQAKLKRPGRYQVNLLWPVHPNRASNTLVAVTDASGKQHEIRVNQRDSKSGGRAKLGEFEFDASAVVEIRNDDSDGYVIADAVQFIPGAGASE
ncbi:MULTISPECIES: FAD-dependent oxidoreductase [Rhodopirellula]|uniref:FAD-dependent oxidoreductase n=1 Tax=Rhodopirellula TaxID=265488 RepID=UPI00257E2164|nr:FAD-dependent oxidoreductase [Rhodopirellula sp. UBA1907]